MFYHASSLALGSPHEYPSHQKAILYPAYKCIVKPTVCKAFRGSLPQPGKLWGPCEPAGAVTTTVISTITAATMPATPEVTTQIKSNEASWFETICYHLLVCSLHSFAENSLLAIFFFSKRQFLKALKYNVL